MGHHPKFHHRLGGWKLSMKDDPDSAIYELAGSMASIQPNVVLVGNAGSNQSLFVEEILLSGLKAGELSVFLAGPPMRRSFCPDPLLLPPMLDDTLLETDAAITGTPIADALKERLKLRFPRPSTTHPFLKKIRTRKQKLLGPCWNYEPCEAQVGTVVVGEVKSVTWWCHGLQGQRVPCVRVFYDKSEFFICNVNDVGAKKVWRGLGGTWTNHRSIPEEPGTFIPDVVQPNPTYRDES